MILIESSILKDYQIVEGVDGQKPLVIEGPFSFMNKKNQNERFYPAKVWSRNLDENSDAMQRCRSRNMFGEIDHPDDGRTLLKRTSHLVTALSASPDGAIIGRAEVLPTPMGKILDALFRSKAQVGISSRGEGDVVTQEGMDIVQENFALGTFDFVHNPSFRAYPRPVSESRGAREGDRMDPITQEYRDLRESVAELSTIRLESVDPVLRPLVEKQARDTENRLFHLISSAGDSRPLFVGLLNEYETARRRMANPTMVAVGKIAEGDGGDPPPEKLKELMAKNNTATGGAGTSGVAQLPAVVEPASIEPIPGSQPAKYMEQTTKEGSPMAEAEKKQKAEAQVSQALQAALREAEDEMKKSDAEDEGDADEKAAATEAKKIEARLQAALGVSEADLMPSVYEPAPPKDELEIKAQGGGDMAEGDEDENPFAKKDDDAEADKKMESRRRALHRRRMNEDIAPAGMSATLPPPPKGLAAEDDEDDDAPMYDESGCELPKVEARYIRTIKKFVKENKKLRWQRQATEAIAAGTIKNLAGKLREANKALAAGFTVKNLNGKTESISRTQVPAVIESLLKRIKESKDAKPVVESTSVSEDMGAAVGGPFQNSKVLSMTRLNESLPPKPLSESSPEGTLLEMARMGARLATRVGRN